MIMEYTAEDPDCKLLVRASECGVSCKIKKYLTYEMDQSLAVRVLESGGMLQSLEMSRRPTHGALGHSEMPRVGDASCCPPLACQDPTQH